MSDIITHICWSLDGRESAVTRMGEELPLIEGWVYCVHPSDETFRDWRRAMRKRLNGDTR
jgi:hypothetical protein